MTDEERKAIALRLTTLLRTKAKVVKTVKQVKSEVQKTLDPKVAVGIYKIPQSEKPFSIYFAKPLTSKITSHPKPVTSKEYSIAIMALLSKNPNYIYLKSVKVGSNPTTYWFKDTSKVVCLKIACHPDRTDIAYSEGLTLVLTESEIRRKIQSPFRPNTK